MHRRRRVREQRVAGVALAGAVGRRRIVDDGARKASVDERQTIARLSLEVECACEPPSVEGIVHQRDRPRDLLAESARDERAALLHGKAGELAAEEGDDVAHGVGLEDHLVLAGCEIARVLREQRLRDRFRRGAGDIERAEVQRHPVREGGSGIADRGHLHLAGRLGRVRPRAEGVGDGELLDVRRHEPCRAQTLRLRGVADALDGRGAVERGRGRRCVDERGGRGGDGPRRRQAAELRVLRDDPRELVRASRDRGDPLGVEPVRRLRRDTRTADHAQPQLGLERGDVLVDRGVREARERAGARDDDGLGGVPVRLAQRLLGDAAQLGLAPEAAHRRRVGRRRAARVEWVDRHLLTRAHPCARFTRPHPRARCGTARVPRRARCARPGRAAPCRSSACPTSPTRTRSTPRRRSPRTRG